MMYGWYGGDWGIGAWIVMALTMVLLWGGIIAFVVLLVRRPPGGSITHSPTPSHHVAESILNERFARGEIDEDEYNSRRVALRHP